MNFEPYFSSSTRTRSDDHLRDLVLTNATIASTVGALLNSTLFFFWFVVRGNCRDIAHPDVARLPVPKLSNINTGELVEAYDRLMSDLKRNSKTRVYNYKTSGRVEYQEFYPRLSKPLIDDIDLILADSYDMSEEELDHVINYDIKYRLGADSDDEDAD